MAGTVPWSLPRTWLAPWSGSAKRRGAGRGVLVAHDERLALRKLRHRFIDRLPDGFLEGSGLGVLLCNSAP